MRIEKVNINDITMYENNAKEHPEWQIEQIKKSIQEFGFNDPIAIDEKGIIIEGHGRFLALKDLGYTEIEVIRLNHLTEEQKVAYSIAHNKLTMNTDFDLETLKYEINKLQNEEFDLSLLGFENIELEEILEEEEVLELEEEAEEKLGGERSDLICPNCRHIAPKKEFKEVLKNGENS
nr:MAG TPA: ParB protein [Caudoviricetes sp.]